MVPKYLYTGAQGTDMILNIPLQFLTDAVLCLGIQTEYTEILTMNYPFYSKVSL